MRVGLNALLVAGIAQLVSPASANPIAIDRAVISFTAPEMGGAAWPRFVWQRELAFLARIEAFADTTFQPSPEAPYAERHLRAALERAIAETLLESLDVDPKPSVDELKLRAHGARLIVLQRIGGAAALTQAAFAEGIGDGELWRIFQRQARASLYLDRMVAPMLEPSEAELRNLHQGTTTPFGAEPFERVRDELRRWYVGRRLQSALMTFYEGARSRIHVEHLGAELARPRPARGETTGNRPGS